MEFCSFLPSRNPNCVRHFDCCFNRCMIVCSQNLRAVAKEIQNGGQFNGLTLCAENRTKTNIFTQEKAKITTAAQFLSS